MLKNTSGGREKLLNEVCVEGGGSALPLIGGGCREYLEICSAPPSHALMLPPHEAWAWGAPRCGCTWAWPPRHRLRQVGHVLVLERSHVGLGPKFDRSVGCCLDPLCQSALCFLCLCLFGFIFHCIYVYCLWNNVLPIHVKICQYE
jgi:hypothetical protein